MLSPQCGSADQSKASILHLVLPRLSVSVVPDIDPGTLSQVIIDSLWLVFETVREWHQKLQDSTASILVWAWPGEASDRPLEPFQYGSATATHSDLDQLSLLPSVSGLLRCVALELDRSIVLVSTEPEPELHDVRDASAFLSTGAVLLGDCRLAQHRLFSHEPSILTEARIPELADLLDGHILSLGGARGIVAEMLIRLAAQHCHLSVVGRTESIQSDSELSSLSTQDLMRALIRRHRQSGDQTPIPPRVLQREVERIQRQAALQEQLSTLQGRVKSFDYHTADISNPHGLQALLDKHSMSNVSVLISGAGVIRDQSCLKKSRDSFDSVLKTKVVPLCVLLCRGLPVSLKTWVSFSSIASKSGNPGQADYAAANEFLNTVVHWFSRRHPEICMRTINWGPWKGSGMATTDVLQAFHSRGLEAVEPDAAAEVMRQMLFPLSSPVEVSVLALQQHVIRRLLRQQALMALSPLWKHHSLPVKDSLASDELRLLFHPAIPYLQGHRKNGRAVVPAALIACLAADLAATVGVLSSKPLHLNLYVINGITIPPGSSGIIVHSQTDFADDDMSGSLTVKHYRTGRPYYKVTWTWVDSQDPVRAWQFKPYADPSLLLYCDPSEIYSACLFHSGVMARLCDHVVIDPGSQTSWCRALPTSLTDQLGVDMSVSESKLANFDLTILDALLQLVLVQTTETLGVSALPQELAYELLHAMPVDTEVELTATIVKIEASFIEVIGACRDSEGTLLMVMKPSKLTISKDLLDFQPGIARSAEVRA